MKKPSLMSFLILYIFSFVLTISASTENNVK